MSAVSANPPVKVAMIITNTDTGGVERIVRDVMSGLPAHGYEASLYIPKSPKSDAAVSWFASQGVTAIATPAVLPVHATHGKSEVLALRDLILSSGAAIVNLHYGDNHIVMKDVIAARLAGVRRVVVSVYHPTPWGAGYQKKRRSTFIGALLAHRIMTISRATRLVLQEAGIPKRRIVTVTPGAVPPPPSVTRVKARIRFGIPDDALVVGTAARLVPHKGVRELVTAFVKVRAATGKRLFLLIAGDGEERAALEKQVALMGGGGVHFAGWMADTNDIYAASDVFVLPSHMEGFGVVYVEAAFHGVPSIGTDVGGIPEAILEGETGLLVPVGDAPALEAALSRLVNDDVLRVRLGARAREWAYAEMTATRMAEKYAKQLFA